MSKNILTLTSKQVIRVGFLPDIHAGSTRSVCTPIFKWYDANGMIHEYHANKAQLMLYKLWKRNIELYKKYKVQHIFVIGDAFQGENYFGKRAYVFVGLGQQVELAADLLEEVYKGLKKKCDFYIWRGTKYHELPAGLGEMHKALTRELQARGIPAKFMYNTSYVELQGGTRMRRLFIAHEAPSALVYPATLMSRDINWCLQSRATGATLPVDAIIRAHLHTYLHIDHSGIHAVQLPCWQGHIPYKATIKYFFKLQPTLGGAVMLMDEYGRLDFWGGSYPFSFDKAEKVKFHRLCITEATIEPDKQLPSPFGVNKKWFSKK